MMIPGLWSGWLAAHLGYKLFFIWVVLATIPSFFVMTKIPVEAGIWQKESARIELL